MTVILDENENPIHPRVYLPRPPVTKDELWETVRVLWGVEIPRIKVCKDHVAPFDAFAEGYFGNASNWSLWYGSRGTGKSLMLALLALTKAAILEINVALLGGSMAQSQNVQEHIENLLLYPAAPSWAVAQQIQTQITFTGGNWIRPLPASQKTVRGPHPQMTCVAGWTLVNTLDGDIPIEEIQVGQRIWVSDDLATPRAGVVQRVIDQGWKETVTVYGDYGVITCTADHQFHTQRGWVEAGDLQPNDVLTVWQPPDWARLQEDRTVSELLADMWQSRETHLLLWKSAIAESDKVPELLHGVKNEQSPKVPGLWISAEAGVHAEVQGLPSGMDDHGRGARKVCSGKGDGQGRHEDQQSRAGSGNAAYTARYLVPDASSTRSMGDRLLASEAQPVDRGSRVVLARPAKEQEQGLVETANTGNEGLFSVVPTHGREGILVGGIVRRVEPGPYCHVYDITTDAGNFYANGVLFHNCLDEIDEMDIKVYNAAMGQAMAKPNARGIVIPEMVIASSTWQNPTGTFQTVRDEALRKGLPVRTWCFREVLKTEDNPTGWMDPAFIDRKKASVPAELFRVEYELGEPAGGSRAFDLVALNKTFIDMAPITERHAGSDDEWVFEEPQVNGWYALGADWAKEEDKTVIVVFRIDESVRRCVYLRRVNRRPWPEMAKMFNDAMKKYQAVAAHDATGIGNVVNDLIDDRVIKFTMNGAKRGEMLMDYISAVEQLRYKLPANTPAFDAHKAATQEDVYGKGGWKAHLPDDVAAFALCHYAAEHGAPIAVAEGVKKTEYRSKAFRDLEPEPEPTIAAAGEVRVADSWNPFLA
jgi:hypothetical protein